jgi:uncharacterized OB-fold protein
MITAIKIWREKEERYKNLNKTGKVISWTRIISPPKGFGDKAYIVVMVEFSDKQRVIGELVDGKIKTGDKVQGILRKLGKVKANEVIEYGVKWKKI